MEKHGELFSPNHLQAWKIAWWAKNLSLVVLVIYIISAGLQIIQFQNTERTNAILSNQPVQSLVSLLSNNPVKTVNLIIGMVATVLKGIVYFLVLNGVSIGLNMIVETDINYRENQGAEDE